MVDNLCRLQEVVGKGGEFDEVRRILTLLMVYVKAHFKAEEALMAEHGYHRLAEHLEQHAQLERQLDALYDEHVEGGRLVSWELLDFLGEWLTSHLDGADSRFFEHLRTFPTETR